MERTDTTEKKRQCKKGVAHAMYLYSQASLRAVPSIQQLAAGNVASYCENSHIVASRLHG
jgi:hypothetical protein